MAKPKSVLIVEDDPFLSQTLSEICADLQLAPSVCTTAEEALEEFAKKQFDCCIVDLALPTAGGKASLAAKGGFQAGLQVLRAVRRESKATQLVCITGLGSPEVRDWCKDNGAQYLIKPVDRMNITRALKLRKLKAFVVHGRNDHDRKKAERALAAAGIEPVVLFKQPDLGRTVIEKFEEVAGECDCAIVVCSSDDLGGLATSTDMQRRARQNVVLELGFFLGHFGRKTGRTIYLEFGETEIPSDIQGLVRMSGNTTDSDLAESIGKEMEAVFG